MKVVFAPLSVNLTYADECLREMLNSGMSDVDWLRAKGEWTRAKMVEFMGQGAPQGEALERAQSAAQVQWTLG